MSAYNKYWLVFASEAEWKTKRTHIQQEGENGWYAKEGYSVDEWGQNITPATCDVDGKELTPAVVKDEWLVNVKSKLELPVELEPFSREKPKTPKVDFA